MPAEDRGLASSRRCRIGQASGAETHGPGSFVLSSRASVRRAARDLGGPREVSRTLRRNTRAFGSLPYLLLLRSNAKIHRIRVHPAGANVDGNLAPEHEVVRRN